MSEPTCGGLTAREIRAHRAHLESEVEGLQDSLNELYENGDPDNLIQHHEDDIRAKEHEIETCGYDLHHLNAEDE
jgi:hypothetical protein